MTALVIVGSVKIHKQFKFLFVKSSEINSTKQSFAKEVSFNPLSPNIHKQILQTDLYTFL